MSWKGEFLWVIGLIAVVVTEAWAVREPKPENVGAWLAALVAFVAIERVSRRPVPASPTALAHPNDPPLMRALLEELPADTIQFFREHDFLGTFQMSDVKPLRSFVNRWSTPDHVFQDATLEAARLALVGAAAKSSRLIAFKTRPLHGDLLTVKPSDDRDDPYPDWVIKDAKEMDEAADELALAYDKMVTLGRQRLDVSATVPRKRTDQDK